MILFWVVLLIFAAVALATIIVPSSKSIVPSSKSTSADRLYPPLENPTSGLRLLVVQPGKGSQPIKCTLESSTFFEKPTYTALSYTWGSPNKTRTIKVDGRKIEIRDNLYNALQHIRNPKQPITLWVDAISINQNDVNEKNQQVPLMAFIYSRSVEVVVWLGSHKSPDYMTTMNAYHYHEEHKIPLQETAWMSIEPFIYRLTHEEYWKRAWIIQEIGMATSIKVLFGKEHLPWTNFIDLVRRYQARTPTDVAANRILKLASMRESKYAGGETYSLSNLLDTFRDCFCGVQHDKVYAFLGMANDHFTGDITVNYSQPTSSIYSDVIQFQNLHSSDNIETQIGMLYFSGLVRRLLSRESGLKKKEKKSFLFDSQGDSWMSWWATNQFTISLTDDDNQSNAFLGFLMLDGIALLFRWAVSFVRTPKFEMTTFWHASKPEDVALWHGDGDLEGIKIRGVIVSLVEHIGPLERDILGTFETKERLRADLAKVFPRKEDLVKAIGRNERLMDILEHPSPSRTRNIISFEAARSTEPASLRIFVGSDMTMGVVPPNVKVGDYICQFWNSTASAVLRNRDQIAGTGVEGGDEKSVWRYEVVGRAGIVRGVEKGEEGNDWDRPGKREVFGEKGEGAVELVVSLGELTRLGLDTVDLGYVD